MRPYLRVANVFEDRIDTSDLKQMDFSGCFDRYRLEPGDVLLNEGQSPELLGRPAIYRGEPANVAFTNTLIRLRPSPAVSSEWALVVFRHYMRSGRFAREARITTNIAHLSSSRLKAVEFPVPPICEQRRIVAMVGEHLTSLDSATTSATRARARIDQLRAAGLERTFGSTSGPAAPLGEFIAGITAGRSFGSASRPAALEEWGIVKVSAMTKGSFREGENKVVPTDRADIRYEIRPGDLLVSRANTSEYVGASVLVPEGVRRRLLLSDKSMRLQPLPGVAAEWLWRTLQAPRARAQMSSLATGTKDSMRNISQAALRTIEIPLVGPVAQVAAIQSFQSLDDVLSRQAQNVDRLVARIDVLRSAVLAAAFSGSLIGDSSDPPAAEELAFEESE